MQTVLKNLHSVPGVMGCLLLDDDGSIVANSLPAIYDAASLKEISTTVAQNIEGLQDYTGGVVALDMRYEHGRLVAKKMSKNVLVLLCQQTINIQLLQISLNVAINKLEKLVVEAPKPAAVIPNHHQPPVRESAPAPQPQAAPATGTVRTNDKGIILATKVLDSTSDMSANSLIGPISAAAISNFFHGLDYKNLLLNNPKNGKSVKVPVKVLNSDPGGTYNGVIGITPSIAGDIGAKNGDDLVISVATSKGFFG